MKKSSSYRLFCIAKMAGTSLNQQLMLRTLSGSFSSGYVVGCHGVWQ